MHRNNHYYHYPQPPKKKYGFWNFCMDAFLTPITGGLWLIWIIVREARK